MCSSTEFSCKRITLQQTTNNDGTCSDSDSQCTYWSKNGECERNPFWMHPHCQKSCNTCGKTVADVQAPTPRNGEFVCVFCLSNITVVIKVAQIITICVNTGKHWANATLIQHG
jgi:hypothetical protein